MKFDYILGLSIELFPDTESCKMQIFQKSVFSGENRVLKNWKILKWGSYGVARRLWRGGLNWRTYLSIGYTQEYPGEYPHTDIFDGDWSQKMSTKIVSFIFTIYENYAKTLGWLLNFLIINANWWWHGEDIAVSATCYNDTSLTDNVSVISVVYPKSCIRLQLQNIGPSY